METGQCEYRRSFRNTMYKVGQKSVSEISAPPVDFMKSRFWNGRRRRRRRQKFLLYSLQI